MYGYIYAIMVSALWGGSVLLESSIIAKFSPAYLYVIGGLVFGLTSLSVLIVNWKTLLPMFARTTPTQYCISIVASLMSMVLANYLFLLALEKTSKPNVVSAIAYSAPIFTLIGSILLLQEKSSTLEIVGVLVTLIGVGIVSVSVTSHH